MVKGDVILSDKVTKVTELSPITSIILKAIKAKKSPIPHPIDFFNVILIEFKIHERKGVKLAIKKAIPAKSTVASASAGV